MYSMRPVNKGVGRDGEIMFGHIQNVNVLVKNNTRRDCGLKGEGVT